MVSHPHVSIEKVCCDEFINFAIPAQAGIHLFLQQFKWIPLFAGVTFLWMRYELEGFSTNAQVILPSAELGF